MPRTDITATLPFGNVDPCGQQSADQNHEQGSGQHRQELYPGAWIPRVSDDERVRHEHTARNPAKQAGAQNDYNRKSIDQLKYQRAAPDNNGHAYTEPEDDVVDLMVCMGVLGGSCNRYDVIQAH